MPGGLVQFLNHYRLSRSSLGSDRAHILGKIPHLVQGIPNGQLHITFRSVGAQKNLDSYQILRPTGQRYAVSYLTGLLCRAATLGSRPHRQSNSTSELTTGTS